MPRYLKHTEHDHALVRQMAREFGYSYSTVWVYLSKGTLLGHKSPQAMYDDLENVKAEVKRRKARRGKRSDLDRQSPSFLQNRIKELKRQLEMYEKRLDRVESLSR